jgi:hypothetical protein
LIAENLAFPEQKAPANPALNQTNALIKARVDSFYPQFDCEPATVMPVETWNDKQLVNGIVSWDSRESSTGQPFLTSLLLSSSG